MQQVLCHTPDSSFFLFLAVLVFFVLFVFLAFVLLVLFVLVFFLVLSVRLVLQEMEFLHVT